MDGGGNPLWGNHLVVIFSAGSQGSGHEVVCRKLGVGKLYSVMSPGEVPRIKAYDNSWGIPLMVDSGAHSYNKHSLFHVGFGGNAWKLPPPRDHFAGYYALIQSLAHQPITFVELDIYSVLPKAEIDAQYAAVKAIPGTFEYIRVYHSMLDGGTCDVVRQWVDEGHKYIGVGADALPVFSKLFKVTRDKVKVHGFAMTRFDVLTKYPFFSVDSTSPLTAAIFGTAMTGKLRVLSREVQRKERSVSASQTSKERLYSSLEGVKEATNYLTKLWEARGVVWQ